MDGGSIEMPKAKSKRKSHKRKPSKKEAKKKLYRTRLKWAHQQFTIADARYGQRCVSYFNCPISDTKRFPRVRRLLEQSRMEVNRWKAEIFRLESLIRFGKYKELD